ncbi:hypothetical protein MLD38_007214 [Melastoma candidum]|uniref:Uncharacterized protein n=1 Tax=Melastoma candidum TaxID=119954 RepID=A0ACB9RPP5_9MYRT|nr:hypothetical protein MLD38_007214 [Melastoma candidum]
MALLNHFLRRRSLHPTSRSTRFATLRHSSSSSRSLLPLSFPTFQIWASNTSLGKTLVSAGLAFASLSSSPSPSRFLYLKPVQTGFPLDSDSLFLFRKLSSLSLLFPPPFPLLLSHQLLNSSLPAARSLLPDCAQGLETNAAGFVELGAYEERLVGVTKEGKPGVLVSVTGWAWKEAVSPDLAAKREGGRVDDAEVLRMLSKSLWNQCEDKTGDASVLLCGGDCWRRGQSRAFRNASVRPVGPVSLVFLVNIKSSIPLASANGLFALLALSKPLRLPAILVGDGRLGGISGTISAYESLTSRGYDVLAVLVEDHGLLNEASLRSYLKNRIPVLVLPKIPEDMSNDLMDWFGNSRHIFMSLRDIMLLSYRERVQSLLDMPKKAGNILWWPFTQHKLVPEGHVTVIDSRCGENFAVFKENENWSMSQLFDACASWWTQGPDATMQTELARDIGYAAARYGHVMFPENVNQPALECAELLLSGVGKGWASRVYFSDNGSTAIEIALKMAFRKFCVDHAKLLDAAEQQIELLVLALHGSYHGDTLGAMEAQSQSPYTSFLQQPWYSGRGLFLHPPTIALCDELWELSVPEELLCGSSALKSLSFNSREDIFLQSRDASDLARLYSSYISKHLSASRKTKHIGALIIEPVIQAAGGMLLVDPLFQRVLVDECRRREIPVIFDEVFTGCWRLGVESAAELLGCSPDIACFAKLLTGGMLPLAATLATDAVFNAFLGETKLKALLHGHSYTAHAAGCAAAVTSIKWFKDPQTNCNINPGGTRLNELWDTDLVNQLSSHPAVQRVITLGTLFALELQAEGPNAGYGSLYARSLLQMLHSDGIYMRPLGNVIYLMCTPCTSPRTCNDLLGKLILNLDKFYRAQSLQDHMLQQHEHIFC